MAAVTILSIKHHSRYQLSTAKSPPSASSITTSGEDFHVAACQRSDLSSLRYLELKNAIALARDRNEPEFEANGVLRLPQFNFEDEILELFLRW